MSPFVRQSDVIRSAATHFDGFDQAKVARVLAPWILTKQALDQEERVLWKTKQLNRVVRRPLMQLPHPTGDHLCFSKRYVDRAFDFLFSDMSFGILPVEWRTPQVSAALKQATQRIDKNWEMQVHTDWIKRGLPGCRSVDTIRLPNGHRVRVPEAVGEIDLLHFDPMRSILVVGEIKRNRPTHWNPSFADEKAKFLDEADGYVPKLLRKVAWVRENWRPVCEHLRHSGQITDIPVHSPSIGHVIVTDYQSIATVMTDLTCIASHKRMMTNVDERNVWTFSFREQSQP